MGIVRVVMGISIWIDTIWGKNIVIYNNVLRRQSLIVRNVLVIINIHRWNHQLSRIIIAAIVIMLISRVSWKFQRRLLVGIVDNGCII